MDSVRPVEPDWEHGFTAALCALNAAMGHATMCRWKKPLKPEDALTILQAIAAGSYQPSAYFEQGPAPTRVPSTNPPDLHNDRRYLLFRLHAETPLTARVSVDGGGVIFEDPVLAVAAARNAAARRLQVLPVATDHFSLWRSRLTVLSGLSHPDFDGRDVFVPVLRVLSEGGRPRIEAMTVQGDELLALRLRGQRAVRTSKTPQMVQLYQRQP